MIVGFVAHGDQKSGWSDLRHTQDVALLGGLVNLITWQLIAFRFGPPVQATAVRIGLVANTIIIVLIVGLWVLFT